MAVAIAFMTGIRQSNWFSMMENIYDVGTYFGLLFCDDVVCLPDPSFTLE